MTLDEYSKKCEEVADAVHLLMEEFDDEDDPQGIMQAVLVGHLRYVLTRDIMDAIGRGG